MARARCERSSRCRHVDYWSYQVCLSKGIQQYHVDLDTNLEGKQFVRDSVSALLSLFHAGRFLARFKRVIRTGFEVFLPELNLHNPILFGPVSPIKSP